MTETTQKPTPFLFSGKNENQQTGILLIHGFTGSTAEMEPMGRYFHDLGYTVCAPLLKGHGTTPKEMDRTNWVDWLVSAKEGYQRLKEAGCEHIVVIGLSMGGLLALKVGQHLPVMGVVTLCAPIKVRDKRMGLARYVQTVMPYKKRMGRKADHIEEHLFIYEHTPLSSVVSLGKLMQNVEQALPFINEPILVVQSAQDETVDPISGQLLYDRIGSQEKELLIFKNSTHIITLDQEQERLHEQVTHFIDNLSS